VSAPEVGNARTATTSPAIRAATTVNVPRFLMLTSSECQRSMVQAQEPSQTTLATTDEGASPQQVAASTLPIRPLLPRRVSRPGSLGMALAKVPLVSQAAAHQSRSRRQPDQEYRPADPAGNAGCSIYEPEATQGDAHDGD